MRLLLRRRLKPPTWLTRTTTITFVIILSITTTTRATTTTRSTTTNTDTDTYTAFTTTTTDVNINTNTDTTTTFNTDTTSSPVDTTSNSNNNASTTTATTTTTSKANTTPNTNTVNTIPDNVSNSPCTISREGQLVSCNGVNRTVVELFLKLLTASSTAVTITGEAGGDTNEKEQPVHDIRELSLLTCRVPELTKAALLTPAPLEVVSVVSSRVEEVLPNALELHEATMARLSLAFNLLTHIPAGVANLTRLEVLDLRGNLINRLVDSNVFSRLHRLRRLHLDHNRLGHGKEETENIDEKNSPFEIGTTAAAAAGATSTPPAGAGIPNLLLVLAGARNSLTHLTLSHNGLTALPHPGQLAEEGDGDNENVHWLFPWLTHLDLSANTISVVPSASSTWLRELRSLQHLDLSDNLLHTLSSSALPPSLTSLHLRGNPWNCTCDSLWILTHQQQHHRYTSSPVTTTTTTTTPLTITTPSCATPLYLRNLDLASLTESEMCTPSQATLNSKVIYIGDQVEGPLQDALASLQLLNVTGLNHQGLLVSWRVEADFYYLSDANVEPLSWAITLKGATQNARMAQATKMRLERYRNQRRDWEPVDSVFTEVLDGLEAETMYVLCLVPVQKDQIYYIRPDHCLHGSTLPRNRERIFPNVVGTRHPLPTRVPKIAPLSSSSHPHYSVKTEMVTITSESRSVNLSWNVTIFPHRAYVPERRRTLRPLGWRITYRRFSEEDETEVVLVSRGGEPLQNFTNHYAVQDLQPRTGYVFCFHSLTDPEINEILAGGGESEDVGASGNGGRLRHMTPSRFTPRESLSTVQSSENIAGNIVENVPVQYPPPPQPSNTAPLPSVPSNPTWHTVDTTNPVFGVPQPTNPGLQDSRTTDKRLHDHTITNPSFENPRSPNPLFQGSVNTNPLPQDPRITVPFSDNPGTTSPTWQDSRNTNPIWQTPRMPSSAEQDPNLSFTTQGTGRSFHQQVSPGISTFPGSFNIPPVPNIPPLPSSRPPRPPRPQSEGNFVYTSTGERIRLPSLTPGANPPFNLPVIGPAVVASPPPPSSSKQPRQRFIYEFDDGSTTESTINTSGRPRKQTFTYETSRRRKRSLNTESPIHYEKILESGVVQICREVVTLAAFDELLTPVAIASTVSSSTTVAIVIFFCCCCWPRRCGKRRKQEGWSIKRTYTPRQVSNISAPSPVNVFSSHTTMMSGSVVGERDGALSRHQDKNTRSVSVTSSSGYLMPIQLPNGVTVDPANITPEIEGVPSNQKAYLNLLKNRLLQRHKDMPDFHPGYDIPPNSHQKRMIGYDYPHPTPVNPIGDEDRGKDGKVTPALPSPSSSNDSNYNATVASLIENKRQSQVNLNIPFSKDKSSNIKKTVDLHNTNMMRDSNGSLSGEYNNILPEDTDDDPSQVSYTKNPQSRGAKNNQRKYGSPRREPEDKQLIRGDSDASVRQPPQDNLSKSVPDLASLEELDNTLRSQSPPVSLPVSEHNGYANFPILPPKNFADGTQQGLSSNSSSVGDTSGSRRRSHHPEMYHTWSSGRQSQSKGHNHPSLGEVVLTGGTLIEVPEGYVVPRPPKPAPIKLLVRGDGKITNNNNNTNDSNNNHHQDYEDETKDPPKIQDGQMSLSENNDNEEDSCLNKRPATPKKANGKSKITHLMTPESNPHRLVINTGMPL